MNEEKQNPFPAHVNTAPPLHPGKSTPFKIRAMDIPSPSPSPGCRCVVVSISTDIQGTGGVLVCVKKQFQCAERKQYIFICMRLLCCVWPGFKNPAPPRPLSSSPFHSTLPILHTYIHIIPYIAVSFPSFFLSRFPPSLPLRISSLYQKEKKAKVKAKEKERILFLHASLLQGLPLELILVVGVDADVRVQGVLERFPCRGVDHGRLVC